MSRNSMSISRRQFLAHSLFVGTGVVLCGGHVSGEESHKDLPADDNKALIAITLDLEMSRNFPTWEQTHWDYKKGNLNDETKKYTLEACGG